MAEGVELYRSWTVDQLKAFLRELWIPLSGNKEELVKKVTDIVYTDKLEEELLKLQHFRVLSTRLKMHPYPALTNY